MTDMSHRSRVWWLLLAAGCLVSVATLGLPWRSEDFRLGVGVRLLMTLAGVVLLARVAQTTQRTAPVVAVGVLGAAVLAYPAQLALAAAGVDGPAGAVLGVLGAAGHVLPLTLVQLAPVLASREVVGRRHRRWETAIVVVAVVGVLLVGLGLGGVPGADALLALSTLLWFGSFLLAPVATVVAVRGTTGGTRHRALVAALAALVPVVVLSWCLALGVLAADLTGSAAVTALLVGFAVGTCACGVLVLGARGPATSPVLRTSVVIGSLHAVVAALALIVGTVTAVTLAALGLPTAWAVGVGAAAVLAGGPPWLRLHGWTRRVVDPAAALTHELAAVGRVEDGHHRQTALLALRRVVGDPALTVTYDAEGPPGATLARHPDGTPAAWAQASTAAGTARLASLGDCSGPLGPAVLEARFERESRRADAAARAERRRVSQDLHDGIQGRLLGLALHLQLGARDLTDPGAALLAEEAVDSLRAAVEDVRALGGGRVPELLAREGLGPALSALFRPAHTAGAVAVVHLHVPARRLGSDVEATVYFVVAEAVTNALKHAEAERVDVTVGTEDPGRVSVRVTDDGVGGADPRLGSGLRGLAERVSAAGGVLVVHGAGPGTTVEAVLPCGS